MYYNYMYYLPPFNTANMTELSCKELRECWLLGAGVAAVWSPPVPLLLPGAVSAAVSPGHRVHFSLLIPQRPWGAFFAIWSLFPRWLCFLVACHCVFHSIQELLGSQSSLLEQWLFTTAPGGDGQAVVLTIQLSAKRFYELFNFFFPCKINVITTPALYTVLLG